MAYGGWAARWNVRSVNSATVRLNVTDVDARGPRHPVERSVAETSGSSRRLHITAPAAVAAARRQRSSLGETAHRPFPLPRVPWVMGQSWLDLLFAHWRVPAAALRPAVPAAIPIDVFDGSAWIGVTPFEVLGLHPRALPPLPRFPELNVRTYTTIGGRPGIWFFSLDAARVTAVAGARLTYRLPYRRADMEIARAGGQVAYSSRAGAAVLRATYEPAGPPAPPAPGTLEHFLTERYCLYTLDRRGGLRRAVIHHAPWPLQPAHAAIAENTMTAPLGIELAGDPLVHFSARQDVLVWPPVRVRDAQPG
jgi:uncharacterized protein